MVWGYEKQRENLAPAICQWRWMCGRKKAMKHKNLTYNLTHYTNHVFIHGFK